MATVSIPVTGRQFAFTGCISLWRSTRVPRATVEASLSKVGINSIPPIDHYAALLETGNQVVEKCAVKSPGVPIKSDSLSRSAVGVEFFATTKGDKKNQREFLFSIGVDKNNQAFVKDIGSHPNVVAVLGHPQADTTLDTLYQSNLLYMPARDVTEALTAVVMANRAVRLADGKGVFFVPESGVPTVDAVFQDMNNAGCRCMMWANDLSDPNVQSQVLEATNEQLVTDLGVMQQEIQAILSDPEKRPRINGLTTKMQALAKHADLLDYYKRMFNGGLDTAEKSLAVTFDLLSELQIRYRGDK
jgi:hypothetical protein